MSRQLLFMPKERVYVKQASGHEVKDKEDYVYLLQKALYGTKQAAHAWQQHLKQLLKEQNFSSLILDPATYVKRAKDEYVIVGTHVDDLFVLYSKGAADSNNNYGYTSQTN